MLRPTTRVSHARSDVEVGQVAKTRLGSGFYKNPARRVSLPVHVRPLHIELLEKQKRIEEALAGTPWNRLRLSGDHGVIASGISSLYAQEALLEMDLDLSFLKVGTFPAPSDMIRQIVEHVSKVIVVEELEPVLEEQVEKAARKYNPDLEILGKESGHIPRFGELELLAVIWTNPGRGAKCPAQ
jgi:indolepyruvate ferredoxin oxidoreductase alpha subunit